MTLKQKDIRKIQDVVRSQASRMQADDPVAVEALMKTLVSVLHGRFESKVIEPYMREALAAVEADGDGAGASGENGSATPPTPEAHPEQIDPREPALDSTGVAPYRFVPLADTVLPSPVPRDALSHGRPLPGGLCGTIRVTWTLQTPLLIGDPVKEPGADGQSRTVLHPFKLDDDHFAIPGASLRGAIRAVLEPATFSRMSRINDHLRFAVRDFENAHYQQYLMQAEEVRAGWLRQVTHDGEPCYELVPCSWARLPAEQIEARTGTTNWVDLDLKTKRTKLIASGSLAGDLRLSITPPGARYGGMAEFAPAGAVFGRIVVSDKAPPVPADREEFKKKVDYVFFSNTPSKNPGTGAAFSPAGRRYPVHESVIALFHRLHSNQGQDPPEPQGAWQFWSKAFRRGEWIPVFYTGPRKDDPDTWIANDTVDSLWLGLTRLFRMPTRYSVGRVRDFTAAHASRPRTGTGEPLLDIAEALFGYVDELENKPLPRQVKSRVMVGFATTPAAGAQVDPDPRRTVLMGPKPQFYPYYLRDAAVNGYNTNAARLSGWKRYPVRPAAQLPDLPYDRQGQQNEKTATYLRFLHPKRADGDAITFTGDIHVHNLLPCELGAVLWAITFGAQNGSLCHALGHAKPFGYGRVSPGVTTLNVRRHDGGKPDTVEGYIEVFKTFIEGAMALRDGAFDTLPQITSLTAMADPNKGLLEAHGGHLSYPAEGYKGYKAVRVKEQGLRIYK